jgi:integral membrane protein
VRPTRARDLTRAIRYRATMVTRSPTIRRFRTIALAEGVSFLVLLGIAMPLKYAAGMPLAVKVVGWMHGLLFITYAVMAGRLFSRERWPLSRAPGVLLAALLPFGTFVLDRKWLR